MKKYFVHFYVFSVFLLGSSTLPAQVQQFEFEKITPADFQTPRISDTSAEAVVIADVGNTRFDYAQKGFCIVFERKTRIHILKPEGKDHATIVIPLYKSNHDKEFVESFKGFTYNLEKGEVVKTKVRNEDMFTEEESEHWENEKIAMPAIRENSIIEFQYRISSEFIFNLQPWTFQSSIPVMWSEYNVLIPEYFDYKMMSQGYVPFKINETLNTTQRITIQIPGERYQEGYVTRTEPARTEILTPFATQYRWVAVDVPALKPEPYITTVRDYLSSIAFELATVRMPRQAPNSVMDTWETLNKKLLEHENFGMQAKKGNFISKDLSGITNNADNLLDIAKAIYHHLQKRMKWNGEIELYSESQPRKTYEERTGSSSDINLMLVAMLREAGINADPVILSTRSHGRVMEMYPILSKFNYVIALVKIGGEQYLLDATSPYAPFNTLPERCLNGSGRIISKENPGWVQLLRNEIKNEYTVANLSLDPEGVIKGTSETSSQGLNGNERREKFRSRELKDYLKDYNSDHSSWSVDNYQNRNLDTLDKPFVETCDLEVSEGVQVAGDRIYLNVMAGLGMKDNPLKLEKRVYPVDFSCPMKESYQVRFTLPEGWVTEEVPKSAIIELPGKAGFYKFMTTHDAGSIRITSMLQINKTLFLPDEYEHLKEFFRMISGKHSEQIVLKKT